MTDSKSVDRRKFLKICAGAGAAVAASPSLITRAAGELRPGERVRLVDAAGNTFDPAAMSVGRSYVFHYPYVTTPCFLIDLGAPADPGEELITADGETYRCTMRVREDGSLRVRGYVGVPLLGKTQIWTRHTSAAEN